MSADIPTAMPQTLELGKIHQGDCIERMRQIESGTIDLVFADPPFNIGYEYDEYHDRQTDDEYIEWSRQWMEEVYRVLKPNGTFWLSIGDEYAAELKVDAEHKIGFATRSWVIWYYTFGVNCTKKFSRSHVHLFHFVKDANNFTFNAEDPLVRVPSARALVYGDKRANPAGRLPDDTWILRPQDLPEGFQPTEDIWYYARVAGTFKERQGFHGCQMPEQLLGRIIRVSSNPGDIVLDPFAGSGTTLAAAKKLGRKWLGCELSEDYVRASTERLEVVEVGGALDGPADPIASAPSTANGRRLGSVQADAESSASDVAEPAERSSAAILEATAITNVEPSAVKQSPRSKRELRDVIHDAIVNAFYDVHEGNSIDWLLANPRIQARFHAQCDAAGLIGGPAEWNRALLRLRKTGEFPKRVTIKRVSITAEEMDQYCFAAEMAWKMVSENLGGVSLDEILCDPEKAKQFDDTAKRFGGVFQPQDFRWAALHLRKASKELVLDAKKYRHSALKGRDFKGRHDWKRIDFDRFSGRTGVYILRNRDGESLYVGDTVDLGARLQRHANGRASSQIATISIVPPDRMPADDYRAPLRVELARQYATRFNVDLFAIHNIGT